MKKPKLMLAVSVPKGIKATIKNADGSVEHVVVNQFEDLERWREWYAWDDEAPEQIIVEIEVKGGE